jgi:PTS system N-acetylgalactosamine-specific IIA component
MKKIIVTGHGLFATGLKSTIKLLAGEHKDIYFVDFAENDLDHDLKRRFEEIIHENPHSDILFFCDLLGGTPYKTAATLAFQNDSLEVVAGCNVGSLIEMLFMKENYDLSELAVQIISVSHNATGHFEKVSQRENENVSDGI